MVLLIVYWIETKLKAKIESILGCLMPEVSNILDESGIPLITHIETLAGGGEGDGGLLF